MASGVTPNIIQCTQQQNIRSLQHPDGLMLGVSEGVTVSEFVKIGPAVEVVLGVAVGVGVAVADEENGGRGCSSGDRCSQQSAMTRRDELTLNPETLRPPLILHGAELLKGKIHAHNRLWISDPKRGTGDRRGPGQPWPTHPPTHPPTSAYFSSGTIQQHNIKNTSVDTHQYTHPSTYCHNHTNQHAANKSHTHAISYTITCPTHMRAPPHLHARHT